jgi:hypothetical protein
MKKSGVLLVRADIDALTELSVSRNCWKTEQFCRWCQKQVANCPLFAALPQKGVTDDKQNRRANSQGTIADPQAGRTGVRSVGRSSEALRICAILDLV